MFTEELTDEVQIEHLLIYKQFRDGKQYGYHLQTTEDKYLIHIISEGNLFYDEEHKIVNTNVSVSHELWTPTPYDFSNIEVVEYVEGMWVVNDNPDKPEVML